MCFRECAARAWHANRGASFGLRQLQRRLQQREQALELAGHQREAGVELGADVLGFGAFELVDHAVEELELRMIRSSPSTTETWSSSTSASLVTCLPDSRCLAISSRCSPWF